jgi:hypothetical protein
MRSKDVSKHKFISKIEQVSFHRNGIGGNGFHAVLFRGEPVEICAECEPEGSEPQSNVERGFCWESGDGKMLCNARHAKTETNVRYSDPLLMLGVVFDDHGNVAVFEVGKLSDPAIGVAFGENSYRGDRYEPELRAAIRDTDSDGSVRVGPFAIPTKRAKRAR